MLGSSFTSAICSIDFLVVLGPVRTVDGRICSNPCEAATASIDLKYYSTVSDNSLPSRPGVLP
jgi:hypothetical protein